MDKIRKEIIEKIDIVEEIKNYVDIEKSGQNYKCICPFHEDTNPSLVISPEKKIFKCFVCGTGGSVVEFVQKYEKIPYVSAVNKLAKKIGIEVKETPKSNFNVILENIDIFYQKILENSELGEEAKNYLLNTRNINMEQIRKFGLGFSPKYSKILYEFISNFIKENNMSAVDLEKLQIFSENGYDLLQNRITIPIHDEFGNVVGFSGRTQDGNVKYLNSKQSPVFDKSKILYNFHNIISNDFKKILIVEGFFDVITASQSGIENVVATMGVAFTNDHLSLLKKHKVLEIYLGFDTDNAGIKTTNDNAKILLKNNFNVKVITYEDAKDLDEFLQNNVNTKDDLFNYAQEFPLYYINQYTNKQLDIDQKSNLINEIVSILNWYDNIAKRNLLIDEISSRLEIDRNIIVSQLENKKLVKPKVHKEVISQSKKEEKLLQKEKILFYIVANNYSYFLEVQKYIEKGQFEFEKYLDDFEKLKDLYEKSDIIDQIVLLDELEYYYELDNELSYYKSDIINGINIENYINSSHKKKINKLKKLF